MTTKKTGKPSRGRVPNDPLDWVEGVGQTNSEENATVTQPVADKPENVSAAPVQTQTLIERKQEKTMSETKSIEQSGRCEAIGEIRRVAEAVRNGNLEVRADVSEMKGECAEAAGAVNEMLAHFSQQQQQQQQQQHYNSILAGVSTCVQLVDADFNIILINPALEAMFAAAEADIRKQMPYFDKTKLIGMNMDAFHKNPAHQRNMLEKLTTKHSTEISLGERTFSLVATVLRDTNGVRTGALVEWADITAWNSITTYLDALTNGEFDHPIIATEQCQGTAQILQKNAVLLRDNIKNFIHDMQHMSSEHDKGDIDVVIDAAKFKGGFADMANGVNGMVLGHIAVKKKAMACIKAFGEGDFNAELEQFPGKKAFINDTIELVRDNLIGFTHDMQHMSSEHDKGDIDVVIDAAKFKGGFADMANGVNGMVLGHIAVKKKAMACIKAFGEGDFNAELEQFPGKKAFINDTIELVRGNLRSIVMDMGILSQAIVDGQLNTKVDASRHQGDYAKIIAPFTEAFVALNRIIDDAGILSQAIVDGQLNTKVDASRHQGDYAKIIAAFENALVGLNNTFYQLNDTVEQVGQSAEQLNAASQNMAANSEEQSSSVEEVTSSLEETDSQVKANTDNANAANQLVMDTSQAANQGQVKMAGMIGAMDAINQSSQDIAKIIKVIDEIAFQTNLLALNAAVEAARAGQHGRGFAVVAQEVRNLAGRSAKAARETADLIEDSSKRVTEGVGIANETREALDQIVGNVVKVKDLVAEIATASTEQSRGVSQINVAMNQVSKAAQEGSQQAEELASSSGELTNVANQMRVEISRFKLRERQHQASGVGLENISPEMIRQIMAMMRAEQAGQGVAPKAAAPARAKSPKSVLPLDADERGFSGF